MPLISSSPGFLKVFQFFLGHWLLFHLFLVQSLYLNILGGMFSALVIQAYLIQQINLCTVYMQQTT